MKWRVLSCQVQNESLRFIICGKSLSVYVVVNSSPTFVLLSWCLQYCNTRLIFPSRETFGLCLNYYISQNVNSRLPDERLFGGWRWRRRRISWKKQGKFIGTLDETPERKFRRAGPLIKFSARTKVTQWESASQKIRGEASFAFNQAAAGARISDSPETVGRSIQLIESTDGFPRAPDCLNWIENCWQQREKREKGRTRAHQGAEKKRGKVNQYSMVVTLRLLGFRFIPLYAWNVIRLAAAWFPTR